MLRTGLKTGFDDASEIVWKPTRQYLEDSNIARFMRHHKIDSYEDLIARSTTDIEWFWSAAEKFLGVDWFEAYSKVLDTSQGIQWAKWFVGGKINIAHNCIVRHAHGDAADKTALIWEDEEGAISRWTYAKLEEETNKLSNALLSLEVHKGDVVGVYMPMVPQSVVAEMAIAKIGAIFMPIFSGFGAEAVATRLVDSGAKVLLTCNGFCRRGRLVDMIGVAERASTTTQIVMLERVKADLQKRGDVLDWDELVAGQSSLCETRRTESEDPFMLIHTSGTTGHPKGAIHVHGGLLVKLMEEVAFQVDLKPSDILFWLTDMGWLMGPWETIGGLALGGTVFIYDGAIDYPKPDRIWEMVDRHDVTILGLSPTAIRALMRRGDNWVDKHQLDSLRILASTGEPWNPPSWMWYFEKVGHRRCPIINISGGTEIGACFLSPHPINPLKPCTLVGPSLGMNVDVFDEDGNPVRGVVGELVAKKPWPAMTRGLWKSPERYIETYWSRFKDIWFHGDFARIDEEGFWFVLGRSDDTIKISGKRVGPAEVESAVALHPGVAEVAAIGVPDEIKGESIACFVVLKSEYIHDDNLPEAVKIEVETRLGKPFRPSFVEVVRDLPKTRNGKILRRLIRARYLGLPVTLDLTTLENPSALEEIRPRAMVSR